MASPFLTPGNHTENGKLVQLHLRRDLALPTILSTSHSDATNTGYAEGVVTNTRFGSFPHSTLVDIPWGSQVRASDVDTGSRGRKTANLQAGKKRKSNELEDDSNEETETQLKDAVTATSGFTHVLPPTPENWTTSLPHRTQVVYTPDYSYILHRIRARPGSQLIESGSGSGSFTHAAARAVFSSYSPHHPAATGSMNGPESAGRSNLGKVFSYEFHAERYAKITAEMQEHGLNDTVHVNHRDVCDDGFAVDEVIPGVDSKPQATSVFLDLPAPWLALPHLSRNPSNGKPSVLDPDKPVYIGTFSPCVEQVQQTVSALRQHGWIDIDVVEMQQKRIEVRREYIGLEYEGMRGVNAIAADIDQALAKLKDVEQRAREFQAGNDVGAEGKASVSKGDRQGKSQEASKTLFNKGTLIHRSEPELKTHTSYLVFAVLPRLWTEADEAKVNNIWKSNPSLHIEASKSQRQLKREAKQKAQQEKRNTEKQDDAVS